MMIPRKSESRYVLAAVVLLLALGCGDGKAPPSETFAVATPPPEVSWEEQVADVRDGNSTAISVVQMETTPQQWALLAEGCERLVVLEADVSQLTDSDLDVLARLPELRRLKLIGPVDDAGLSKIAQVQGLTTLNLPEGTFSDDGLAELSSLSKLELLRFSSPQVSDAGLSVVTRLPALRFLHLLEVPITDAGLEQLHGLQQLESFYLDGGRCTDAGLHALLKALPELHFHQDQLHLPDDPQAHPHE